MKHWTKCHLEFEKVNKNLIEKCHFLFFIFFEIASLYYKVVTNFANL
jgi:hypothetical protein